MISLKKIFKNFGETEIYKDVNYKFREKGLTCFFGPSGSGKTTLLNLIAGFDKSYSGEIEIEDKNLKDLTMDELCRYRFNNIGFIFQNYNLLKGYTSLENVLMGIHLNNKISEDMKIKKGIELLTLLGLENQVHQKIESLSGGQKQRVSIARALVNDPNIILADEPTGALDSESSDNIMEILKQISKDRTVIIITHDEDIARYADEIIEVENNKIVSKKVEDNIDEVAVTKEKNNIKNLKPKLYNKVSKSLSRKNFKIHLFKYIIAGTIIALGSAAFIGSLSTKNITNKVVEDFKNKNFFYNIGQSPINYEGNEVDNNAEDIFKRLENTKGIKNVYYQYDLKDLRIKQNDSVVDIPVKVPTATAKESLSYGNMPRINKNEIVLSSSIANRLTKDIQSLIGKEIVLQYKDKDLNNKTVTLTVSGLSNSQYQDFILSQDVEQKIYKDSIKEDKPTAISFTMEKFEDIPIIDKGLKDKNIGVYTKAQEVESFEKSFTSLLKLYTALSYLILIVGIAISSMILYKVSIERYNEVGLLGALGYTRSNIKQIFIKENIYFATLSTSISCILITILDFMYKYQFGYGLNLGISHFLILICLNLLLTIGLSYVLSLKLIKTEPAVALSK
ncbi:MAG: ATP-binding cassette domain-containing protein [Paraclostridium sp.]